MIGWSFTGYLAEKKMCIVSYEVFKTFLPCSEFELSLNYVIFVFKFISNQFISMKIHSFSYWDKDNNREVERVYLKDLTLLVGASGVGKTEILHAIRNIGQIAAGASLSGVEWSMDFSIGQDNYIWEGRFKSLEKNELINLWLANGSNGDKWYTKPMLIYEKIIMNDDEIVKRKGVGLTFKGEESPFQIKEEQSVINLISDPLIKKIANEFKKIIYSDYTNSVQGFLPNNYEKLIDKNILNKYKNIDNLRNSREDIRAKLFWVHEKESEIFEDIKEDFISIFSQVTHLKVDTLDILQSSNTDALLRVSPFIQFKEKGMKEWATMGPMSAGMYRTLKHVMELYLSPEGTIILIDEFENSLGVNCIDELTTIMKGAVGRIQFIITNHHPYIINNIHYKNWKIVTRNGGKVSTQDADDFMGKSKHEAFIQLINHPSYKTGKSYA